VRKIFWPALLAHDNFTDRAPHFRILAFLYNLAWRPHLVLFCQLPVACPTINAFVDQGSSFLWALLVISLLWALLLCSFFWRWPYPFVIHSMGLTILAEETAPTSAWNILVCSNILQLVIFVESCQDHVTLEQGPSPSGTCIVPHSSTSICHL
jgi:hypothetical protein